MTKNLQNTRIDLRAFGKRLRNRRKQFNLSQEALGVLIGLDESCSRARISRYETGVHEPDFVTAKLLANSLRAPLEYFFCERDLIASLILLVCEFTNEDLETIIKKILQHKKNNTLQEK